MKKRVVILAKYFPPDKGGMEVYCEALAKALRADFDVHVLAHARGRQTSTKQWEGFRITRCGTWVDALSQPFSPAMLSELYRLKPDIVHLNAPNAFATLCWWMAARSASLVITHHADVVSRATAKLIYTPLYRLAANAAQRIILLSLKNVAHSVDLPPLSSKMVAIPQGLDPADFAFDDVARDAARAQVRTMTNGAPAIIFVGRLIPYKGLDVLQRALVLLPQAHVVIVGTGPLADTLTQSAQARGVADRFHLVGEVDEATKKALVLGSDVFALPSISVAEAFGIVQVEAQMCGKPVVASNLPSGVSDVTVDGVTGLLFPPGDERALAQALGTILADPVMAQRMGEAGRARALDMFTSSVFAAQHLRVFKDLA